MTCWALRPGSRVQAYPCEPSAATRTPLARVFGSHKMVPRRNPAATCYPDSFIVKSQVTGCNWQCIQPDARMGGSGNRLQSAWL